MSDRHPKWTPVGPGTVIPAGQPYRVEYSRADEMMSRASEYPGRSADWSVPLTSPTPIRGERTFLVDSSWRPPLVLPTEPGSVIEATWRSPDGTRDVPGLFFLTGGTPPWVSAKGGGVYYAKNLTPTRVLFDAAVER